MAFNKSWLLRKFLYFCLIGLVFSCSNFELSKESQYKNTLLWKFAKIREKYGLVAVGIGGSTNEENKISSFFIAFETNRFITLEEARFFLVENIQALLEIINADKKNQSYYEKLPFPAEKIDVSIYGNESEDANSKYIYISHSHQGILSYNVPNPKGSNYPSIKIHKETFEEAKRIVVDQKKDTPLPDLPETLYLWKKLRTKCGLN